jgi:predicted small metal-binding protein
MAKKLDCPIEGCHASIEAETEAEVMAQAEAHATSEHPEVKLDEETVATIRGRIRDV